MFPWEGGRVAWVVLDNAERLPATLVAPLLSLAQHTRAAVSWVLVSRELPMPGSPFTEGLPPDLATRLTTLHFPPYSLPQLSQVPLEPPQAVFCVLSVRNLRPSWPDRPNPRQ